ncbi:hypothetical protein C474_00752 [Halogeometricum pallidum JCM 14848]|uniref:DUF7835 domain-containing protein n=1 Tax=Halogeometricum pallidum JCM 14848 TaxID=1227487 RepID=M0DH94_HALPD|nr:hypothetical protein [Halogeometricum pallidum]ELZ34845.1 hypothetical protein C474_00752 [Halogeometricum pallidum JCM 14848]
MIGQQDRGVPEVAETVVRACSRCGGEREHKVTVSIRRTESRGDVRGWDGNDAFDRGSYKVLKCLSCGQSVKESDA